MTYCGRLHHAGHAADPDPAYQARHRNAADAGERSFLPIKVNMAGVIPIIFAISLMLLPATIINAIPANTAFVAWLKEKSMYLNPGNIPNIMIPLKPHPIAIPFPFALVFYFLLVIVFTYFYTAIVMNVQEMADNLKKYGNYIPGIRPGKPTLRLSGARGLAHHAGGRGVPGLIAVSQYILPSLTGFSRTRSRSSAARRC